MSYEPTTWKTGDVVTSTKLNKMEQGIADAGGGSGGGGVLVVNMTADQQARTVTLDKTWQEIYDAITGGKSVIAKHVNGDAISVFSPLLISSNQDESFGAFFYKYNFTSSTADGVLVYQAA